MKHLTGTLEGVVYQGNGRGNISSTIEMFLPSAEQGSPYSNVPFADCFLECMSDSGTEGGIAECFTTIFLLPFFFAVLCDWLYYLPPLREYLSHGVEVCKVWSPKRNILIPALPAFPFLVFPNYGRWRIHFFFFFPIFLFEMRSHHRVSSCSDVNTVGSRRKRRMLVNSFFEDTCLQRMKEKMLWLLSPSIIIIDAIEIVSIEQFVKKALIFSPPCSFLSVFRVPINLFRSKIRWTRLLWVILLFVQRNIKTISRIRC